MAYESEAERIARMANVAANGRWATLALVAVAIAAGDLRGAVIWAFFLILALLIEQVRPELRLILMLAMYAGWGIFLVLFCVISL